MSAWFCSTEGLALPISQDIAPCLEGNPLDPVSKPRQKRSSAAVRSGSITKRKAKRPAGKTSVPLDRLPRPCVCAPPSSWNRFAQNLLCRPPSHHTRALTARRLSSRATGCRTAKVLCDRKIPCTRCTRLGVECTIPKTVARGRPTRARQLERAMEQQKQKQREEADEAERHAARLERARRAAAIEAAAEEIAEEEGFAEGMDMDMESETDRLTDREIASEMGDAVAEGACA